MLGRLWELVRKIRISGFVVGTMGGEGGEELAVAAPLGAYRFKSYGSGKQNNWDRSWGQVILE